MGTSSGSPGSDGMPDRSEWSVFQRALQASKRQTWKAVAVYFPYSAVVRDEASFAGHRVRLWSLGSCVLKPELAVAGNRHNSHNARMVLTSLYLCFVASSSIRGQQNSLHDDTPLYRVACTCLVGRWATRPSREALEPPMKTWAVTAERRMSVTTSERDNDAVVMWEFNLHHGTWPVVRGVLCTM
ncbi:uncharacterized protein BCR38DRAFT_406360 [Pseudomassariella vexata]|uniref:Uncharacterized protein n=1 Tax=Pseudomassariella vexata TaxID=1141098 RepID=A0A1Y2EA33_9PEZI|nr:uncharacterized protein BCR38DRAFT_406360 [Pseudomassariella vexata]ORY68431.1 hypothetical protein BCR38DRAFT_406360 [Pseudomassariella vexata]